MFSIASASRSPTSGIQISKHGDKRADIAVRHDFQRRATVECIVRPADPGIAALCVQTPIGGQSMRFKIMGLANSRNREASAADASTNKNLSMVVWLRHYSGFSQGM
jgi:hypothetical protein